MELLTKMVDILRPAISPQERVTGSLAVFTVFLLATVGNAQIFGLDLVLAFCAPCCFVFYIFSKPSFSQAGVLWCAIVVIYAIVLSLQAIRFDALVGYSVWPLKACLVALFAQRFNRSIEIPQIYLLAAFSGVLLLSSADLVGRSYGLFGPNMQYRFYGLLILIIVYSWVSQNKIQGMSIFFLLLSIFGILRTGSVGGILLLLVGLLFIFRPTLRILFLFFLGSCVLLFAWNYLLEWTIFKRLVLKASFDSLLFSTRGQGILDLLSFQITLFGNDHETFQSVWRAGYEYPHNVFIELISFFGVLGLFVAGMIICSAIIVWKRVQARRGTLFDFAFIVLFVSTNLSGELSDNYGVVGFAIAILYQRLARVQTVANAKSSFC